MNPLIETLWPAGESGIIAGQPEVGKTRIAFAEAVGIALGVPVLSRFKVPETKRVLFIEEELQSPALAASRVHGIARAYGLDQDDMARLGDSLTLVAFAGLRLRDLTSIDRLRATIDATRAEVVYVDSLFRVMPGADMNSAGAVTDALGNLDQLAREFDVRFRLLHHLTKSGESLSGSQALIAWRRDGLRIARPEVSGTTVWYEGNNASGRTPLGRMHLERRADELGKGRTGADRTLDMDTGPVEVVEQTHAVGAEGGRPRV